MNTRPNLSKQITIQAHKWMSLSWMLSMLRQGRTLYGFGGLVTKQRITDEDEIYLVVVVKMKTPERWRRFLGKMKMEMISGK